MGVSASTKFDIAAPPSVVREVLQDKRVIARVVRTAQVGRDRRGVRRWSAEGGQGEGVGRPHHRRADLGLPDRQHLHVGLGRQQPAREAARRCTRWTETPKGTHVQFDLEIDLKVKLPGLLVKQGQKTAVDTAKKGLTKESSNEPADDRCAIHRDRRHDRRRRMPRRRRRSGDRLGGQAAGPPTAAIKHMSPGAVRVAPRRARAVALVPRGVRRQRHGGRRGRCRRTGRCAIAASPSRQRWPVRPEVCRRAFVHHWAGCHVGGPIRTGRHSSPSAGGAVAPSRCRRAPRAGRSAAAWVSNSGKLCIHSGAVGFQN